MNFNEILLKKYKPIWDEEFHGRSVNRAELQIQKVAYNIPSETTATFEKGTRSDTVAVKKTVAKLIDSPGISHVEIDFLGLVGNGEGAFTSPDNPAPIRPSEMHVSARGLENPPSIVVVYEISITGPPDSKAKSDTRFWNFMDKLVQLERNILFLMTYFKIEIDRIYSGIYMKKDGSLQKDVIEMITEFKLSLPCLFLLMEQGRFFVDF